MYECWYHVATVHVTTWGMHLYLLHILAILNEESFKGYIVNDIA